MAYTPHAVKTIAGIQPAVVDTAYFDYNAARPADQRYKIRIDANLLGHITARSKLRGIAYVGELSVTNPSNHLSASAVGGLYDPLVAFLMSPDGGGHTVDVARSTVLNILQGRYLSIQTFAGRLVAT